MMLFWLAALSTCLFQTHSKDLFCLDVFLHRGQTVAGRASRFSFLISPLAFESSRVLDDTKLYGPLEHCIRFRLSRHCESRLTVTQRWTV